VKDGDVLAFWSEG